MPKLSRIEFKYDREYPTHSEWRTIADLSEIIHLYETFEIETSTAALFVIVRSFCLKNEINLVAAYQGIPLNLDRNMRMPTADWTKCPDFEIYEDALDTLLEKCTHLGIDTKW